jgi:hypothetical protein
MSEDLVSLLIYLALGLVGVIASAYKNKAKRQQANNQPRPQVPRTFSADPEKEYGPDLGPLVELFDIPKKTTQSEYKPEYESVEYGPSVEESGMNVDSEEASQEMAGMSIDRTVSSVEEPVSEVETFEEGQSDIQKMIAKYNALRTEMDDALGEDIASSEIVSIEAEEEARQKRISSTEFFDIRKAIIYSEILKRKEY